MSQAGTLEHMRRELKNTGHDVQFVMINKADAVQDLPDLIAQCLFPIWQDNDAVNAWGLLGVHKDDFLILRADGTVFDYLPQGGTRSTKLSTPEGYANVRDALLAAEAAK